MDELIWNDESTHGKLLSSPMGIEDVCKGQMATDTTEEEVIASQTEEEIEMENNLGIA